MFTFCKATKRKSSNSSDQNTKNQKTKIWDERNNNSNAILKFYFFTFTDHGHHTIIAEEELYNPEDPLNANNLEMALYSPLPHLQFTSHSHNSLGVSTPLEDWIKHPNHLTLSSDTLIASLHPTDGSGNVSAPATPTSIFSDTPLPPFSQAIIGGLSNSTINSQGFALPPLENALDFGNVDLDSLPPS